MGVAVSLPKRAMQLEIHVDTFVFVQLLYIVSAKIHVLLMTRGCLASILSAMELDRWTLDHGNGKGRTASPPAHFTIYFGYGSNLWLHQMKMRCPTSRYMGIARLNGYRWIINERGYANVVEVASPPEPRTPTNVPTTNVSYGLVYELKPRDEANLDANEGVPVAYTKEMLEVDFWPLASDGGAIDVRKTPQKQVMLVYLNRGMVEDDKPKKEYIYRMNMGIVDAIKSGVPQEYVDQSLRTFIPEESDEHEHGVAEKQALKFEDEI